MKTDVLVNLVEAQLKETRNMKQKASDLVNTVVNLYTLQLMKVGDIPIQFMEDIMSDLEAEVIEIYRKKTYGFLTLEEYRLHKFRQKHDN
ncbi:hypothetical protein D3C87_1737750 [compost metagenome]